MRKIRINRGVKFSWKYKTILVSMVLLLMFCCVSVVHGAMYDKEFYCCRHMSRDIEFVLEKLGLDVKLISGSDKEYNSHMWVRVNGLDWDSVYLVPGFFDGMIY